MYGLGVHSFFYKDHFFWDRLFLKNLWKIEKGGNNVLFALFIGVLAMKLSKLSLKKNANSLS